MQKILLATLSILLTACGHTTTVRHVPNFDPNTVKKTNILIIPTEAEVNTVDFGGRTKRMYDYEQNIENIFNLSFYDILNAKGYQPVILNKSDVNSLGLGESVIKLRNRYNQEIKQQYSGNLYGEIPVEKAYTLNSNIGKNLLHLPGQDNKKLLLLANFSSVVKTSGARTRDIMIAALFGAHSTSSPAEINTIVVGLIDNITGDLIWCNSASTFQDNFSGMFTSKKDYEKIDRKLAETLVDKIIEPLEKKE